MLTVNHSNPFKAIYIVFVSLILSLSAAAQAQEKTIIVGLTTSEGYIELELDAEKAPISVDNFLSYVDAGHYDGTVFHRVIKDFMIQGGGFGADMTRKAVLPPIQNEAKNGLKNDRGTIAMARTAAVNSATSQFFINVKDNNFLNHGTRDYGYAVFGKVSKGMGIVDTISTATTGARDVPVKPIIIHEAKRVASSGVVRSTGSLIQ